MSWVAISAAVIGGGLAAGGTMGAAALNNSNKGGTFNQYASPEYTRLRDSLYGIAQNGVPGSEQWGKDYFNQQLMPQIRENYETKRNPYGGGFADTPEAIQFATGARGVTSDIGKLNMDAKMNAYRMLSGLVGGPTTTYEQPYDPWADLLTSGGAFAGKMTGDYLGNQMKAKAWKDTFDELRKGTQSTDYSKFLTDTSGGGDSGFFFEGLD